MRQIIQATAALSASSLVKIGVGVVTMKVWALVVGPAGLGEFGVLQSLVGAGFIVFSFGMNTGVVRLGASARGEGDEARAALLARMTLALSWGAGAAACLAFWAFRGLISQYLLDGAAPWVVGLMGVTVLFSVVAGAETGVINAYHRVRTLAVMNVVTTVVGGAAAVAVLLWLGRAGVPWAVAAGAAITLVVTTYYRRRARLWKGSPSLIDVEGTRSAFALARFGGPFTASAIVGTGATLALPFIVLHFLGLEGVGHYRAAIGVSLGYVGFLLTAMAMDYYPRLSALLDGQGLSAAVNDQLRLLLLAGGAVILVAQATAPLVVPILYAPSFGPAVPVLEWQLVGTVFRFWSYAFAFAVLARSSSVAYFWIEAFGGTVLVLGTWAGTVTLGLPGAGIGFAGAYAVYGAVVWAFAGRSLGVQVTRSNVMLGLCLLGCSLTIQSAATFAGLGLRLGLSLALAGAFSAYAVQSLYRSSRRTDVPVL